MTGLSSRTLLSALEKATIESLSRWSSLYSERKMRQAARFRAELERRLKHYDNIMNPTVGLNNGHRLSKTLEEKDW